MRKHILCGTSDNDIQHGSKPSKWILVTGERDFSSMRQVSAQSHKRTQQVRNVRENSPYFSHLITSCQDFLHPTSFPRTVVRTLLIVLNIKLSLSLVFRFLSLLRALEYTSIYYAISFASRTTDSLCVAQLFTSRPSL